MKESRRKEVTESRNHVTEQMCNQENINKLKLGSGK